MSVLPQLIVTEAVRELEKRFVNVNDKSSRIEAQLIALGRKPGFGMVSQIAATTPETLEGMDQIGEFLATRFSQALFNVTPTRNWNSSTKVFTLDFQLKPAWFNSLSYGSGQMSADQTYWFRCYAYFIMGVYAGALLHFGYKATANLDQKTGAPLLFTFKLEELDGTWAFSAASLNT
jgi:hypothetical protein